MPPQIQHLGNNVQARAQGNQTASQQPADEMEPQRQQTPNQQDDQLVARVQSMMKSHLAPSTHWKGPYIDGDTLGKFNICVSRLDFDTGRPTTGHQFIQPMSTQAVSDMLDKTKPFDLHRYDFVSDESMDIEMHTPQWEAYYLWLFIDTCLTMNNDQGGYGPCIIPHNTQWRLSAYVVVLMDRSSMAWSANSKLRNTIKHLNRIHPTRKDMEWQVQGIFRACIDQPDKLPNRGLPDCSKPHLTCYLTNHNTLHDHEVTTGELNAVLWLALDRAIQQEYKQHRIFPVS